MIHFPDGYSEQINNIREMSHRIQPPSLDSELISIELYYCIKTSRHQDHQISIVT